MSARTTRSAHATKAKETKAMLRTLTRTARSIAAAFALSLALAAPASAAEFETFSASFSDTQAGGHPDLTTTIAFETETAPQQPPLGTCLNPPAFQCMIVKGGAAKEIVTELPPGFLGAPASVSQCTVRQLLAGGCPPSSQVGVATVSLLVAGIPAGLTVERPLFNMVPRRGEVARIAFETFFMIPISFQVRPDGGLNAVAEDIFTGNPVTAIELTTWGVPGDPVHDPQRACEFGGTGCPISTVAQVRAFQAAPTDCSSELAFRGTVTTYQDPDNLADEASHELPAPTGCEKLSFRPGTDFEPLTPRADSPTGLDVEITVPQTWAESQRVSSIEDHPLPLATPPLRTAEVTLPEGMTINPGQADGLGVCTDEEAGVETGKMNCPDASRVGTVEVVTPLLDDLMRGGIYLGDQLSDDPESGEMFRMFLEIANEDRGISMVIPGKFIVDPDTGQITTLVEDAPQQPFESMKLHFKGGPRGLLATPPTCGTYEVQSRLTAWGMDEPVELTNEIVIDKGPGGGPCEAGDPDEPADPADLADRPFEPELVSGTQGTVAGSFTPYIFRLKRQDGHQELLSTTVSPPPGVTARLAGTPLCPEPDIQAGSCPEESRVGTEVVGAGPGAMPFYTQAPNQGRVYMADPWDPDGPGELQEAPLSLVIQEPVVAGPFDLADITVRAAVYVDPRTARFTIVSGEIPRVNSGVPLRIRDIRIRMDRPAFTIAPTNCSEMKVEATATGAQGAEAELENRFQVGDCASLGFKPNLKFQATGGKKATRRNAHPGLKANLVVPGADAYSEGAERGSQANIKRVQVTLPKGLFLDQASPALTDPCTREEYAEGNCPASSRVGTAIAHTPLLDEPLKGPVYLRTSDNPLPDLVADLDGIVSIDLVGAVSQAKQRIRNTFQIVPDVPVSSFELRLDGGAKGLLVNSNTGKGLCGKGRRQINVAMRAHNGRTHAYKTQMKAQCPKKAKKKGKGKKAKRAKRADRR